MKRPDPTTYEHFFEQALRMLERIATALETIAKKADPDFKALLTGDPVVKPPVN